MWMRAGVVFFIILVAAQAAWGQTQKARAKRGPRGQGPAVSKGALPKVAAMPEADRGRIKAQAEQVAGAMAKEDYETLADLTHPRVVEMMGGRAGMIAYVDKAMKDLRAGGFVVESFGVGEPGEVTKIGRRLYSIVPTKMRMKVPQGVMLVESYFVATSDDGGGEKWTFIDGSGANGREKVKLIFPEAADKLDLPAPKQPVLQPEP